MHFILQKYRDYVNSQNFAELKLYSIVKKLWTLIIKIDRMQVPTKHTQNYSEYVVDQNFDLGLLPQTIMKTHTKRL